MPKILPDECPPAGVVRRGVDCFRQLTDPPAADEMGPTTLQLEGIPSALTVLQVRVMFENLIGAPTEEGANQQPIEAGAQLEGMPRAGNVLEVKQKFEQLIGAGANQHQLQAVGAPSGGACVNPNVNQPNLSEGNNQRGANIGAGDGPITPPTQLACEEQSDQSIHDDHSAVDGTANTRPSRLNKLLGAFGYRRH